MKAIAAPNDLKPYLQQLLDDLLSNQLEVELFPSRIREYAERGAKIRVSTNTNAEWYRKLCDKYPSNRKIPRRKYDTKIKRANVISTLKTLVTGKKTPSYLVKFLFSEAEKLLDDDYVPF
jgi:hypothetical protein